MHCPVADYKSVSQWQSNADNKNIARKGEHMNAMFSTICKFLFSNIEEEGLESSVNNKLLNVKYIGEEKETEGKIENRDLHGCIEMVLDYWKKPTKIRKVENIATDCCDCIFRRNGLSSLTLLNGTKEVIEHELENNRPILVKWKASGNIFRPEGDSHWSVIIGVHKGYLIHNDPMGQADLINGGYISRSGGKQSLYEINKWLTRWISGDQSICVLVGPG
jgi:hypothetical protein